MAQVTVPALKPLTHQGRSYVRGELVTAEAIDVAAMAQRGEVSLTRGVVIARDLMPAPTAPPARRTRRQYRRRDLVAEGTRE